MQIQDSQLYRPVQRSFTKPTLDLFIRIPCLVLQQVHGRCFLCLYAQHLPEEHTTIRALQSLLTFDPGLLLPVSSTVAYMKYKHCTALQAVCVLQVWRAGEEGRKRGSYLIPPKGTPLSTHIVNSQANRVAGRHTTHSLLSF